MKIIKISKGNGKFRTIYAPDRKEKRRLRELLPELTDAERRAADACDVAHVAHGFIKNRSPVTAARRHAGDYGVRFSMDLADWFDSVRPEQILQGLELAGMTDVDAKKWCEKVCVYGHPRQGLPTSPTAANLAAIPMDVDIEKRLRKLGVAFVYTRYADDITVSLATDDRKILKKALEYMDMAVSKMGWSIAPKKTKIYWKKAGNGNVLGISVGQEVGPTRRTKRRLRAALHQGKAAQAKGLKEWAACKMPKQAEQPPQSLLEYYRSLAGGVTPAQFDPEGGGSFSAN